MMRRIVMASAVCAGLAGAAAAQEGSVEDQFAAALATFRGGLENPQNFASGYRDRLFAGLAGTWAPLYASGEHAERCRRQPHEIVLQPPFGFTVRLLPQGKMSEVTRTFVSTGGNTFAEQVDVAQLIAWLGLDRVEGAESARLAALSSAGGTAAVFRPSPDILVIQTNYGVPRIFGRCS